MRIILTLLILLFSASNCFAVINATTLIEAVPAGDSADGTFVETIPAGDAGYVECFGAEGAFTDNTIPGGTPAFVECFGATGSALKMIINATVLIELPPNSDGADGAFVELIPAGTPAFVECFGAEGAFAVTMSGVPGYVACFGFVPKQKIHFGQGIAFDQQISFDGGDYLKWTGNPQAIMLIP